jgi:hypothetical protein
MLGVGDALPAVLAAEVDCLLFGVFTHCFQGEPVLAVGAFAGPGESVSAVVDDVGEHGLLLCMERTRVAIVLE